MAIIFYDYCSGHSFGESLGARADIRHLGRPPPLIHQYLHPSGQAGNCGVHITEVYCG